MQLKQRVGEVMSGKERTQKLTRAVIGWLVKKGYSCHNEIGVMPWGRRRADVLGMNLKRDLILVEVKQSWQDLKHDEKFDQYLPFCNQMYVALPYDMWDDREHEIKEYVDARFGLVVLEENGLARVYRAAPRRDIKGSNKRDIIVRLAWRGGLSKRNTRRTRQYL